MTWACHTWTRRQYWHVHRHLGLIAGAVLMAGASPAPVCTAPATHAMLVAELFFGRDIAPQYRQALGPMVTEAQWRGFERTVLTPAFPDGLTEIDARGQWRDPATGTIVREPTKTVIIAAPDTDQTRDRLTEVMNRYRSEFHQQSVGLILRQDCANF